MKIDQIAVRFSFMVVGICVLLTALWGGLFRIGWNVPTLIPGLAGIHGPLIVCGFVGTYVTLERAYAFKGGLYSYLPCLLVAAGAAALLIRSESKLGPALMVGGSLGFSVLCFILLARERSHDAAFNAIASVQWLVGNVIWYAGWPVFNVTLWWMSFVLFGTAGQRLQMARMMRTEPKWQGLLLAALLTVFVGHVTMALGTLSGDESMMDVVGDAIYDPRIKMGMRIAGAGLLLASGWFLRFDVPRNIFKRPGIARYIAVCLVSSYAWLAVCGVLSIAYAGLMLGMVNDAAIHAFFLGFLFFMILGHGPILAPTMLGLNITMRTWYYAQVIILNLSLILRVVGDVVQSAPLRRAGAMGNFVAISLFVLTLAYSLYADNRLRRSAQEGATA